MFIYFKNGKTFSRKIALGEKSTKNIDVAFYIFRSIYIYLYYTEKIHR